MKSSWDNKHSRLTLATAINGWLLALSKNTSAGSFFCQRTQLDSYIVGSYEVALINHTKCIQIEAKAEHGPSDIEIVGLKYFSC